MEDETGNKNKRWVRDKLPEKNQKKGKKEIRSEDFYIYLLFFLSVPGYIWCSFNHICMCGHMAHPPYAIWEIVSDVFWLSCLVTAAALLIKRRKLISGILFLVIASHIIFMGLAYPIFLWALIVSIINFNKSLKHRKLPSSLSENRKIEKITIIIFVISAILFVFLIGFSYKESLKNSAASYNSVRRADMAAIADAAQQYLVKEDVFPNSVNILVDSGYLAVEQLDPKDHSSYYYSTCEVGGKSKVVVGAVLEDDSSDKAEEDFGILECDSGTCVNDEDNGLCVGDKIDCSGELVYCTTN